MNDNTRYLINVGICIERMRNVITAGIFENLSKHNPWFDSKHETEAHKLDEFRRTLVLVKEEIESMLIKLDPEEDDE